MRSLSKFSELIGAEGTLRSVCERASVAAETDVSVALFGENGVGKETLARAIATASEKPLRFVPLRASLVSDERWNEFLAGPEAFQGCVVYIYEAERIPRTTGRRLATALLSGRLGFRVIFGTSSSYQTLLDARAFAPELADVFAAFPIAVPSLKERMDDFPSLADFFFVEGCARLGVWRDPLSPGELERLGQIRWSDNLDGLRRVVETIVARDEFPENDAEIAEFSSSEPVVLTPPFQKGTEKTFDSESDEKRVDGAIDDSGRLLTLDEAMKEHIERALKRSHGALEGKNGAATILDINPYTLRARMKKLGVDWVRFRDSDEEPD